MVQNTPGGPVGAPPGGQLQDMSQLISGGASINETELNLNTAIYDYFLSKESWDLARAFVKKHRIRKKQTPDGERKNNRPQDLPDPDLPHANSTEGFLGNWWSCFWDMFSTAHGVQTGSQLHSAYLLQQRNRQQSAMNFAQRAPFANPAMNGMAGKAIQNRNATPQNLVNAQAKMMGRDATLELNGQRPQTPGDNAPSPQKRPRLENGAGFENQILRQPGQMQMGPNGAQQLMANGQMPPYAPGGPMKIEGQNGVHPNLQQNGEGKSGHALQDYQFQLMMLEEQNKRRLMQAGNTGAQDGQLPPGVSPGGPPGGPPGPSGFVAPNMSPSGSRGAVPSPTPNDQLKRMATTPKMPPQNVAGSPMPEMQNRASPAPGFDPNNQMGPGSMSQAYYANMGNNAMGARPPSSHPNFPVNMNQMTPQAMEQMQRMTAGQGRLPGAQWQSGANPAMQGQNPAMRTAQGIMGPPPAPAGEGAPNQRTQPSSPAQPPAPPTPSQTKANAPKGKKDGAPQKKKANAKKASTAGATPAAESEPAVSQPSTPITAAHSSMSKPGSQSTTVSTVQATAAPSDPNLQFDIGDSNGNYGDVTLAYAEVGNTDVLENFDFDSFLHTNDDSMSLDFNYDGGTIEAGGL